MEKNTTTTASISLMSMGFIVFLVFLILKLTGVINWAWIYVFLPLIIPAGLSLAFLIIGLIILGIIAIIASKR